MGHTRRNASAPPRGGLLLRRSTVKIPCHGGVLQRRAGGRPKIARPRCRTSSAIGLVQSSFTDSRQCGYALARVSGSAVNVRLGCLITVAETPLGRSGECRASGTHTTIPPGRSDECASFSMRSLPQRLQAMRRNDDGDAAKDYRSAKANITTDQTRGRDGPGRAVLRGRRLGQEPRCRFMVTCLRTMDYRKRRSSYR